jgi:hypothetical protein
MNVGLSRLLRQAFSRIRLRPLLTVVFLALAVGSISAGPAPSPVKEDAAARAALDTYFTTAPNSREWLRDVSMEVNIEASLPRLKKSGTLQALRYISRLGKISYVLRGFQGDDTVKKEVIAKYLEAESKATAGSTDMAINPDNYRFRYYGRYGSGDWELHLYELTPREKRVGLFQGWLWIHAPTGLPVREQGELAKNPSIFLKKVSFVRDYRIRDGIAIPTRMESTIETRVVGRAEISVEFSNVSKQADRRVASLAGASGAAH